MGNKTLGPHRASERTGISGLGITDQGALVGSAGPAPKGDQGGWPLCFPRELASSVTPSLSKKSSPPEMPRAAGKREKGQHGGGARGLNHQLVHKNCLITGTMRKSMCYSERPTLGAARQGRAHRSGSHPADLRLRLQRKCQSSLCSPPPARCYV